MEYIILKVTILLVILIGPWFYNPDKTGKRSGERPKEENELSDYGIDEDGNLEEINKKKSV